MLKHLHIRNYALISHLDIDFEDGFSVLTGETGAGKSIILGALSLVLGARADSKSITDGEDKCIIETVFSSPAGQSNCCEYIIRRELYSNGKSRSFVNDSVVTLQELKTLSSQLIDIHSQHANLLIENTDFQLEVVDAIAANEKLLSAYNKQYLLYLSALEQLNHLEEMAKKSQQDADYIQYRYHMLEEAELREGELEELEAEQYRLSHAEELRQALQTALVALQGDSENGGAVDSLRACRLEDVASELQERIDSARIELEDIAHEAARMMQQIEMDPQRLMEIEERIGKLEELKHKFHVTSISELLAIREELAQQVERMDSYDFDIEQARKVLQTNKDALLERAKTLTESRKKIVPDICKRLTEGLKQLGVRHANVQIHISQTPEFTPTGCDEVQILFAANLNQTLRPVSEVASGGEISRLMLCVKALIASTKGLPTIIFDEIDTGVSSDIATQMGTIMREMASTRQIIAITHLPQIAALGEAHYKVYKADTDERTETHISRLTASERITEIATMLSGKNPSPEAIANAKQLLCYH